MNRIDLTAKATVMALALLFLSSSVVLAGNQQPVGSVNSVPQAQGTLSANSNFSTYLGGSSSEDATKVTLDHLGNTILIGQTGSADFPVTEDAIQTSYGGGDWDAYVAKFDVEGDLLFATYLGGNSYEHVTWVRADEANNIIVAGTTSSTNFPTTPSAYRTSAQGGGDGFIAKISPDGENLLFATYFGGSGEDWIYGMEFDASGNLMFSGWTSSSGLATSGVVQEAYAGNMDAFIAKMSPNGQNLLMFSYLGGSGVDRGWTMTSDSDHSFIFSGQTSSTDFPVTPDAIQSSKGIAADAYVAVLSSDGTALNYSSYLGATGDDYGLGIKVDSGNNIVVTGFTESANLNTTAAYQANSAGNDDIFVAKITPDRTYQFCTYLGGSGYDRAWELAIDSNDDIIVLGRSTSTNYPVTPDAYQEENGGIWDVVVTKMSSDGQSLIKSTYFGGTYSDLGEGVVVDGEGNVVVSGSTSSPDLPVSEEASQPTLAGSLTPDSFATCFVFDPPPEEPSYTETTSTSTDTTSTYPETGSGFDLLTLGVVGLGAAVLLIVGIAFRSRK
jgi:hypothetical protein